MIRWRIAHVDKAPEAVLGAIADGLTEMGAFHSGFGGVVTFELCVNDDTTGEVVEEAAKRNGITLVRALSASDVVGLCLNALGRHDEWCGHNADAPGDSSYNKAVDAARSFLKQEADDGH